MLKPKTIMGTNKYFFLMAVLVVIPYSGPRKILIPGEELCAPGTLAPEARTHQGPWLLLNLPLE